MDNNLTPEQQATLNNWQQINHRQKQRVKDNPQWAESFGIKNGDVQAQRQADEKAHPIPPPST